MKKRQKTVPTNISVPLSLKERMDLHPEINWSATACRSFERQLQAQEALNEFAEPDVSEEEALNRALKVQHARATANKTQRVSKESELETQLPSLEGNQATPTVRVDQAERVLLDLEKKAQELHSAVVSLRREQQDLEQEAVKRRARPFR